MEDILAPVLSFIAGQLPRLKKEEGQRASAADILRHPWLDGHRLGSDPSWLWIRCKATEAMSEPWMLQWPFFPEGLHVVEGG